jgi:ATP-dependent DNA helicase 2 subunit 1
MSWWNKEGEENEEEENDEEDEFKTPNDRIIFLIDARSPMFETNDKGESHMKNCLSVALAVMKTKIIANDKASIGLTFFGAKEKDSSDSAQGVHSLFPLAPPSAQRIRQLKMMIEDEGEFHRTVGSQSADAKGVPLKQALWTCSQSFGTKDFKQTDFKRIWIFTNDDTPNLQNPVEQRATVTVAKDCSQAGIEISLWHLNRADRAFDPKSFYMQLLIASNDETDADASIEGRMLGAGSEGFDTLMASVRRKEHKKRRLGSTLFSLGEGPADTQHMGVQLYRMLAVAKKPTHTWLYARTNEPLKVVSKYFDSGTGETLEEAAIETFMDVQGLQVDITKDEVTAIKVAGNNPEAGVRLLFFMPRAELRNELNLESPYFLFPDDKTVKGSSLIFESLLRNMAEKDVLAVVRFNRVASAMPRLAVLLPQLEQVDEDGCQTAPIGFQLMQLPFANDIRFNPLNPVDIALGGDHVDAATRVVEGMRLPADFSYFRDIESPSIQQYYSVLQAVALNEGQPEWTVENDRMQPDPDLVTANEEACAAFKEAVGLTDGDLDAAKVFGSLR